MTTPTPINPPPINDPLRQALEAEGVDSTVAGDLARAYLTADVVGFLDGMRALARLHEEQAFTINASTLEPPFNDVCGRMQTVSPRPWAALQSALSVYQPWLQGAFYRALEPFTKSATQQAQTAQQATQAQQATSPVTSGKYQQVIDPIIAAAIQTQMASSLPLSQRCQRAGAIVLQWLEQHGWIIKTPNGEGFYFWRGDSRVMRLSGKEWTAFLHSLTGVNPASREFKYLAADCQTAIGYGEQRNVVRLAHWDEDTQTLRVSKFNGRVYRLDGAQIVEEANGEGPALFEDASDWTPYEPDFTAGANALKWLKWSTEDTPNWHISPTCTNCQDGTACASCVVGGESCLALSYAGGGRPRSLVRLCDRA